MPPCELRIIKTSGDRDQHAPLQQTSSIGFFTKEIQNELLAGRIDVAVHSLKDLPTKSPDGLEVTALLKRDDSNDVLLARRDAIDESQPLGLARNCAVGASSLRRGALLKLYAPQCRQVAIRGNVTTRIEKLKNGQYEGIILSKAGLSRLCLDIGNLLAFDLNPVIWVPAPGQGIIAVEVRAGDIEASHRTAQLADSETVLVAGVERGLLSELGGGCHVPFGAHASRIDGMWRISLVHQTSEAVDVARLTGANTEEIMIKARKWLFNSGTSDKGVSLAAGAARAERVPPVSSKTDLNQIQEEWLWRPAQKWC